jgi:hypothetical protein
MPIDHLSRAGHGREACLAFTILMIFHSMFEERLPPCSLFERLATMTVDLDCAELNVCIFEKASASS